MSRYGAQTSYGHRCKYIGYDTWQISWIIDMYYEGNRFRYPRNFFRNTDEKKAQRFCKKHNIAFKSKKG